MNKIVNLYSSDTIPEFKLLYNTYPKKHRFECEVRMRGIHNNNYMVKFDFLEEDKIEDLIDELNENIKSNSLEIDPRLMTGGNFTKF